MIDFLATQQTATDPWVATQLSFQFALEFTKQLITVATGVLALSIAFVKDFAKTEGPRHHLRILGLSWFFYFACITFGIWHLIALTGELATNKLTATVNSSNVWFPGFAHLLSFTAATFLMAIYGLVSFRRIVATEPSPPEPRGAGTGIPPQAVAHTPPVGTSEAGASLRTGAAE